MQVQMQPGNASERIRANSMGGGLSNIKGASMTPAQNNPIKPVDPALQSKMGERVARRKALQDEEIDIRDENRRDDRDRIVRQEQDATARIVRGEQDAASRIVREEQNAAAKETIEMGYDEADRILKNKNAREDQIDAVEWERGRAGRDLTHSTKELSKKLSEQNLKVSNARFKNTKETRDINLRKEILSLRNSISTGDNQEEIVNSINEALLENQKIRGSLEEKLAAGVISNATDIYAADGDGAELIDEIIEQIGMGKNFEEVLQDSETRAKLVDRLLHSNDPEFQFQSLKNESIETSKELQKESIKLLELRAENSKGYDKDATEKLIQTYEGMLDRTMPSEVQGKSKLPKSIDKTIESLNTPPPDEVGVNSIIEQLDLDPSLESMIYDKLRSDGVIKNTPGSPEEKDLIPADAFRSALKSIQAQGRVPSAQEDLSEAETELDGARNPSSMTGSAISLVGDGIDAVGNAIDKAPDVPNAVGKTAAMIGGGFVGADLISDNSKIINTVKGAPGQVNKLVDGFNESNVFGDESSKRSAVNKLNYESGKGGAGPQTPDPKQIGPAQPQSTLPAKEQKWIKLNTELSQSHQSFARKNGLKEFKTPMPALSEGSPAVNKWRTDLITHYDEQAKLGRKSILGRFTDKMKNNPKKMKYLGILGGTLLVDAAWTQVQSMLTDEDDPEIVALLNERNQMDEALKSMISKAISAEQEYINSISSSPNSELVEEVTPASAQGQISPLDDSSSDDNSVGSWLDSAIELEEVNADEQP